MKSLRASIYKHSFGQWSLAFFMLSIFSGVFLILPYHVDQAYDSIVEFTIRNPFAAFFRNLHYWSSQLFLLFIILHIFDHLLKRTEKKINTGIWIRLIASLTIVYLVMLSGFILKADADSLQAWEILQFLISSIPYLGEDIAYFILGDSSDKLLIPYIHHVATFTIIILFVLFEHAKQIWPKAVVFVIAGLFLGLVSSIFSAPLQLGEGIALKGPWYFIGFQEILHWMSQPEWSVLIIFLLLVVLFLIKYLREWRTRKVLVFTLMSIGIIYLGFTFVGFYFRGENWQWENKFTSNSQWSNIQNYNIWNGLSSPKGEIMDIQQKESCMWCHSNSTGFSASHDVSAIGCYSCHLGNKLSTIKDVAHEGMELFPGNFSNVKHTCATANCHPKEFEHIQKSLMTTNSGIVAVDKYIFLESDDLNAQYHINDIGFSPAETHLRNLCASCHLGQEKTELGPIHEKSRGGGCLACHLNYPKEQMQSFTDYKNGKALDSIPTFFHPRVDLQIDNNKCFGCHSRSGRISTNYEGWHETLISHKSFIATDSLRLLEDKRVFEFIEADVHHKAGLTCIDCHQYKGVMGDGNNYSHQEEAVKIQCKDCHQSTFAYVTSYDELEREEKNVFKLRQYSHQEYPIITTEDSQTPIINSFLNNDGEAWLLGKESLKKYPLKAPHEVCTAKAHKNVSCSLCHSSWVPQCIGCHNEYDKNDIRAYDLLDRKQITGEWNEFIGKYFHEASVIGVRETKGGKVYEPAAPGMVMTIDTASYHSQQGEHLFHRLYAPVSPHTTQKVGRNCKSCHQNSLSLGFGRGELVYKIEGNAAHWEFTNQIAKSKYDGLPEDAWTNFIDATYSSGKSTRSNFRSLNKLEQKRMLLVASCLQCHKEGSEVIKSSLRQDFNQLLAKKSNACILPVNSK